MQVDAERERQLRQRQTELTSLKNHPSWQILKETFNDRKQKHLKMVAAEIIGEEPINQRQLDWIRGYWAGCSWLLANPEMAEQSLEKALAAARLMEEHA